MTAAFTAKEKLSRCARQAPAAVFPIAPFFTRPGGCGEATLPLNDSLGSSLLRARS